ncbi:hypothetical protein [Saccharopolyspora gloriosae]|uniref:hypothetical protein n=1 Tax=Saccharopolyspora gloriosae TaxID=455344 RepID=UPI001FB7F316|nr:hypothetical protein [Saccharopolyspora gloriosae]
MADELYLNAPEAERVAKELANKAGTFGEAVEALKSALERDYGCWSDDKIGKGFEENYLENAEGTRDALGTLAETVQSLGKDAIPGAIKNVQELDEQYGENIQVYADALEEFTPRSS